MKVRNGFVSNSSSSSYVILLPEEFNVNEIDLTKFDFESDWYEDEEIDFDDIKQTLNDLITDKEIWQEDSTNYYYVLKIVEDYTIAEVDVSSEGGTIILADYKKVKNIITKNRKEKINRINSKK